MWLLENWKVLLQSKLYYYLTMLVYSLGFGMFYFFVLIYFSFLRNKNTKWTKKGWLIEQTYWPRYSQEFFQVLREPTVDPRIRKVEAHRGDGINLHLPSLSSLYDTHVTLRNQPVWQYTKARQLAISTLYLYAKKMNNK